jgi:hypothetical protein
LQHGNATLDCTTPSEKEKDLWKEDGFAFFGIMEWKKMLSVMETWRISEMRLPPCFSARR